MSSNERDQFIAVWQREAASTLKLLQSLPAAQYDFRPDATGRSLGELAWHLAEIDAYMSTAVVEKKVDFAKKIPGLERPRAVPELATGFKRVHDDCVARLQAMDPEGMNAMVPFFGRDMRAGDILWYALIQHTIHHRGQLTLMCRLAGGTPPGLYGPTREEMAAMRSGA